MGKVVKTSRIKTDEGFFAGGGHEKMYGKGHVGSAQSGYSGKESNSSDTGTRAKNAKGQYPAYAHDFTFLEGGHSNAMFGKGHATKATPGVSGKVSNGCCIYI